VWGAEVCLIRHKESMVLIRHKESMVLIRHKASMEYSILRGCLVVL
jgi:hypothetical protein